MLLIIIGIDLCRHAPIKIRIFAKVCFFWMLLRQISLIIMLVKKNIEYLYLLRYLTFVDIIVIPLLACMVVYILARNNKINFYKYYLIGFILSVLYVLGVIKFDYMVSLTKNYGYLISIKNNNLIIIFQLVVYTIILFSSLLLLVKTNNINRCIILLIIACCVSIVEALIYSTYIYMIPNYLISNCIWLILTDCVLSKFSR